MTRALLIGLAGALGTLSRYGVGLWAARALGTGFPFGTLIVNIAGCFLIALVYQLTALKVPISQTMYLTLTTGFMGGLTTYSSFNFESTELLRHRGWAIGVSYVALTLVACLAAGLLGLWTARLAVGR